MSAAPAARPDGRFAGRVALVTGASSGIGRAFALALAAEGAAVGAFARTAADVDAVVAEIEAAGGRALALPGDVGVGADVERAVAALSERLRRPRRGGPCSRHRQDRDGPGDDHRGAVGPHHGHEREELLPAHQARTPAMRERGGGAFVNVSSVYATACVPGTSAYAAAKAAVSQFTRAVALDHAAEGIRFNAIAPGSVSTPPIARAADEHRPGDPAGWLAELGRMTPLGRLIEPREVASSRCSC